MFTAKSWPIGAALLQPPNVTPAGVSVQDADASEWATVLGEVRHAGFDHVDLTDTWLRPGDLSEERLKELRGVLDKAGLGVTAISTVRYSVIDPDPELADANVSYLHRTLEAAVALDTGVVSVGLHRPLTAAQQAAEWFWVEPGACDPVGDTATWNLAVERLRSLGEHAARLGVQVSLELYEDTYLGTTASALALVADIGLPNVGLNPDVGNLIRQHRPVEDWEDILRQTLPVTNYWHIKNYFRSFDPRTGAYFTMPASAEEGLINYRRAIEMAVACGFDGPICVEHYGGDGLTRSARNRDYLRELLAEKLGEHDDGDR
ncbi:sugar phosphate isomerase/epimerase family protein [Streptomyces shenzhenensis]|uniref:sugar phosphate isomerase/epimerase family protein n=1 Tax=Streptomyces shenzhenensis TaxID=943815 RepID=UPI0033CFE72F